jgi:hypothetical protein
MLPAGTGFAPTAAPGQLRQRLPAGDGPSLLSRLGVVRDAREATSQFYGSRQLATGLVGLADGRGVGIGDDQHVLVQFLHSPFGVHSGIHVVSGFADS